MNHAITEDAEVEEEEDCTMWPFIHKKVGAGAAHTSHDSAVRSGVLIFGRMYSYSHRSR